MIFLIHCTFAVIAFSVIGVNCYAVVESSVIGIPVQYSRSTPTICEKGRPGPQCTEDCSKLMLCSSISTAPLSTTTCTAPNQYCVNGACTSKPDEKCSGQSTASNFQCSDRGIFPDPSDCTRFHICEKGSTTTGSCAPGFVYNSQLKICQVGRTPCTKIDCSKDKDVNTIKSYTSNPAYFAFCTKDNTGAFEIIMFKCPHEEFEVYDLKANECKFKCKARGYFQNPAECGEYYYCSGVNAQPMLQKCPQNWVFDGTSCNKNVNKCQSPPSKPDSEEEEDELTVEEPVDNFAKTLVTNLETEIRAKIAAVKQGLDQGEALVPENFRKKTVTGDGTYYFISLTTDKVNFHVKILVDEAGVESVLEAVEKGGGDPIDEF